MAKVEKAATGGRVTIACEGPVAAVADRVEVALTRRGMHIYARIDHQKEAAKVGVELKPLQLFVAGYFETNAPLLATTPILGLDLPTRILVWEGKEGQTQVSFPDPFELVRRYGLDAETRAKLDAFRTSLDGIALEAARAATQVG